jgi:predicted porin
MKKQLIAAAVAAAFVAPAMAQVTVYGRIDQSFQSVDNGTTSENHINDSVWTSGRIGLSGSEDLGGGLKAFFKLEGALAVQDGTVGAKGSNESTIPNSLVVANAQTTTASRLFDRDAFVGVSGSFGSVRIGTIESETSKLFVSANAIGANVAYATAYNISRITNAVSYQSPRISGVEVSFLYGAGETVSASTGDKQEIGVNYKAGPVAVYAASYREELASSAKKTSKNYGGIYDLGFAKVGYAFGTYDATDADATKLKSSTLSVAAPVGMGMTVGAAMIKYDSNVANADANGHVLTLKKDLSKRTWVYAATGSMDNDSGATYSLGKSAASTTSGKKGSLTTIGVAHTF